MNAPCKGCPARSVGCHAKCEKYQAYDAERKLVRERRLMEHQQFEDIYGSVLRRHLEWIARTTRNRKQ